MTANIPVNFIDNDAPVLRRTPIPSRSDFPPALRKIRACWPYFSAECVFVSVRVCVAERFTRHYWHASVKLALPGTFFGGAGSIFGTTTLIEFAISFS